MSGAAAESPVRWFHDIVVFASADRPTIGYGVVPYPGDAGLSSVYGLRLYKTRRGPRWRRHEGIVAQARPLAKAVLKARALAGDPRAADELALWAL